ncbi:hypothetical protein V6N12_033041 [Hibiscus sabdariffa]|uniref:Uncharacterized protein n=1 Tax=Hibiscus sabdariffa TaxID=183260 RepID=A0ABR2CEV5_9ROSI
MRLLKTFLKPADGSPRKVSEPWSEVSKPFNSNQNFHPRFRNLWARMTNGMSRIETTGPALAEISAGIQISAERLDVLMAYV